MNVQEKLQSIWKVLQKNTLIQEIIQILISYIQQLVEYITEHLGKENNRFL